jgi:hypothetical protein
MRIRGGCRRSRFRMRGSCEGIVIASEAKQSISRHKGRMDCFVASLLAMTWMDMISHPRRALRPSCAGILRPPKIKGAGKAGCWLAPAISCAISAEKAHTSIQASAGASGLPCAMVLRLKPRSPWRRIRLASIAGELTARIARLGFANLRRLDTSHGCQDHTVLPYATAPFV